MAIHRTSEPSKLMEELKHKMFMKYCPVFKVPCMLENCQSFIPCRQYPIKEGNGLYIVHDCYCVSPLVTGIIQHEGE